MLEALLVTTWAPSTQFIPLEILSSRELQEERQGTEEMQGMEARVVCREREEQEETKGQLRTRVTGELCMREDSLVTTSQREWFLTHGLQGQ